MILLSLFAIAQDQRRILDEIRTFDEQIGSLSSQISALGGKAAAVRTQAASHRATLDAAELQLRAQRTATATRIQTFYRLKRRGLARLLFDAESPAELRRRVRYLLAVIRADDRRTRAFAETVRIRTEAAQKLSADETILRDLHAELEGRVATLRGERDSRAGLFKDIRSRPQMALQVARERAEASAALDTSIRQREATAPADAVGASGFREAKGRLPVPVAGRIVRRFGTSADPLTGQPTTNTGIDYAPAFGAPVRVVADGTVTRTGYVRAYGQMAVVQHGSYQTLYAHFNGIRVGVGDVVHAGDTLGLAGNTGLAEDAEARLHFEIRYNGTPQDPGEWLTR